MKKEYMKTLLNKNILSINSIYSDERKIYDEELGGILLSFASLGFTIEKESINKLKNCSISDIKDFYFSSIELLKEIKGNNVNHVVFYENFPNIENISKEEYVLRAILHYFTSDENSYGYMARDIKKIIKPYLNEKVSFIELKIVNKDEAIKLLIEYANNMFESKKAIPENAKTTIQSLVDEYTSFIAPTYIPFKENLAFYAYCMNEFAKSVGINAGTVLSIINLNFIKTSTDLLRVYVAFSNGDITLIRNTKFISLNRAGRKTFLRLLDNIAKNSEYTIDDMASHDFLWKKALEKLHVGDYDSMYPNAYKVATMLRNDDYKTYNSSIVSSYKKRNVKELIKLLKIKPGVFARSLDYLVRNLEDDTRFILGSFKEVSNKVSTSLLLQLWEYYKNRNLYNTRIFVVKGPFNSFVKEIDENRKPLNEETVKEIISVIEESLKEIYSQKELIRDVYLDESMKNFAVPTNSRNASSGYHTLTFGTRVKLENANNSILRFFTHWKNSDEKSQFNGRIDIDLSLQLYDEKFNHIRTLAWHNMQGGSLFNSYHSGDITSAPKGASEFIDLDYKEARKVGRYALVCNNVFTGQDFADIPECFSGVMFRKSKGKTGEIFEPTTVKYKFDLTQRGSSQNLAFAIDLETLEMIWIDFPYVNKQSFAIAASSSLSLVMILKKALQTHMSMYDLIKLHEKHIEFSKTKSKANFIISDEKDAHLSPYDIDKITSYWL